jgi:hypothetical protein
MHEAERETIIKALIQYQAEILDDCRQLLKAGGFDTVHAARKAQAAEVGAVLRCVMQSDGLAYTQDELPR